MKDEIQSNVDPGKYGFTEKQTRVLIEDFRKDFKVFGEALQGVRKTTEATFEEVGRLKEDLTTVKLDVAQIKRDIKDLPDMGKDVQQMKRDIADIKAKLKKPDITRAEFDELKQKVTELKLATQGT